MHGIVTSCWNICGKNVDSKFVNHLFINNLSFFFKSYLPKYLNLKMNYIKRKTKALLQLIINAFCQKKK